MAMITGIGLLAVLVFGFVFFNIVAGFWRMRGMASRMHGMVDQALSMAEQEMNRKMREGPTRAAESAPDPSVCAHCGSRVATNIAQCQNCGAGLK
jgi:hypothetical protein